jgi:cysteine-rich repeat protein
MRLHLRLTLCLLAAVPSVHAFEGHRLVRCERAIGAAAGRLLAARRAALDGCMAKAVRCSASLTGAATAATDPCLAKVARRCAQRLAASTREEERLERAVGACGLSPAAFFGDDGLRFSAEPAFCPGLVVRPETPADTMRCQRRALTCAADAAAGGAAPRLAEVLARLGVSAGQDAHCLLASLCGNGVFDGDEECDAGVHNSDVVPDTCRRDCTEPRCGDGVVDPGDEEACDDGNLVDGDGCDTDCELSPGVCGNGVVEPEEDEECDDGNLVDGDGCDEDCALGDPVPHCGDGEIDGEEECDDGEENSDVLPDHCRRDCTDARCGDRVVDEDEDCEPPRTLLCTAECTWRLGRPEFATTGAAKATADRCQRALLRVSGQLFERVRRGLAGCVAGLARCQAMFPETRDPDGSRLERCLAGASRRCAAVAASRARLEARAVRRAAARCAGLPVTELLDVEKGLGFTPIAATCAFESGPVDERTALLGCVLHRVECTAESAVARTLPGAYALFDETELDPDELFPCLTDPDEVEIGWLAGVPAR